MITPLLTQLTYDGLIDELIGLKNCMPGIDFIMCIDIACSTRGITDITLNTSKRTIYSASSLSSLSSDYCKKREQKETSSYRGDGPIIC